MTTRDLALSAERAARNQERFDMIAYSLFWSWNIVFLAFMFLGFAPQVLPEVITSVQHGLVPAAYLAYAIILVLVPVTAVILGLTLLRRSPRKLFAFGYVVEGPLMLILAIRFFVIREATLGIDLIVFTALIGMAAFVWQLLDREIDRRGPVLSALRLAGLTLMLAAALYASVWILFYAIPLAAEALRWVGSTVMHFGSFLRNLRMDLRSMVLNGWRWVPFTVLGFILVIYTGSLFVVEPIAVPLLAVRAWLRSLRVFIERGGGKLAVALPAGIFVLLAVVFTAASRQPQRQAFALLAQRPADQEQAQALLQKENQIRKGLVNAYLAPFRYLSSVGEVVHVRDLYRSSLNMPDAQALRVEQMYEGVLRPVLYTPAHTSEQGRPETFQALQVEPQQAADLYEQFFDESIVEGERATVMRAVRSTWQGDQALAAVRAIDEREIHLNQQEVTIQEHGDWADVELYEVYQNQTGERQEVVYYFNLPETAVVTGLWLNDKPDRASRFEYRVAPRGAAQAVYRNEVRERRDPALIEQIGPRQYRLRVYPVEPQFLQSDSQSRRAVFQEGPQVYMWLTYRVLAQDNAWPLPQLSDKRNVYWDSATVRIINRQTTQADESAWLPPSAPASSPVQPAPHRVDFPGGMSVLASPDAGEAAPALPDGLDVAVILDRSRSMASRADDVASSLRQLESVTASGGRVDLYLTASPYRGEEPSLRRLEDVDPDGIVYYGGQNAAELLAQFQQVRSEQRADESYDAILVLTDGSGYGLGESDLPVEDPGAPVWVVHLGGALPAGYDDPTLDAINASGGGVTGSLDEALTRLAVSLDGGKTADGAMVDVVDGYKWVTLPTSAANALGTQESAADGFASVSARRLILAEMHAQRGQISQPETLDVLHKIAVENSIVTPLSSMIVLVNFEQEQLLNNFEQSDDRFQREHEDVGETAQQPFSVTGVPEPEEWLLILLSAGMLAWYAYRQKLAGATLSSIALPGFRRR